MQIISARHGHSWCLNGNMHQKERKASSSRNGSYHAAACCGMLRHAAGHLLQLPKVFWGPVGRLVHLQSKQVGNQLVIGNLAPYERKSNIYIYIYILIHSNTLFKISIFQYHSNTSLTHKSSQVHRQKEADCTTNFSLESDL